MLKRILTRMFAYVHPDLIAACLLPYRLRILCYHGVVEDELAHELWVPGCFTKRSEFELQLKHLTCHYTVIRLSDAVGLLCEDKLPPAAVCLTFDDGYANNLHVAYPLLKQYGVPATIFLATAYIDSDGFFPFDELRLASMKSLNSDAAGLIPRDTYKKLPLDVLRRELAGLNIGRFATAQQSVALRPLSVIELKAFDPALIDLAPHTRTHCILSNESAERRRAEIVGSIDDVAALTGKVPTVFCYPNGEPGDFDESDMQTVRECGIRAAVTGISGTNASGCDVLALKRLPVGLYHDLDAYVLELSGVRAGLKRLTANLGQPNFRSAVRV